MFDISSMRDCKLPDDKVAIVLEQINDLPRLYAVYVNWFGTDGKKNINGIKKPRLNKDRHMLANSLNTVTALIEKTENDFTDPEGYALPPSLVNAKCELIAARNEIERALHKYDRAIAYLGDGHIPIDLPWRLIAQELFNIIFNATNTKPGYGDQLAWCQGIIWEITDSRIGYKSIEGVLDNFSPNEIL